MTRRKQPSASTRKPTPTLPAGSSSHLVRIDSAAIKREYVRKWQQAQADFARRQQEWDRFSNEERPAYERWLRQTFAARISEIRAAREKIGELQQLIVAIEDCSLVYGVACRALYQELLAEQQPDMSLLETLSAKVRAMDDSGRSDTGDDDTAENRDAHGRHRARDPFGDDGFDDDEDLDDDFGEYLYGPGGEFGGGGRRPKPKQKDATPRETTVRDLYRKLCLRLHPDTGGTFSAATEALWHELQDAYKNQDLERLAAIQAGLDIRLDPMGKHVSCSQLAAAMAELKRGMHSIRAMVRQARGDAAWGFSSWTPQWRTRAERQVAADLDYEHAQATAQLRHLERVIAKWGKRPPDSRGRRSAATPRDDRQFPFEF